MNLRECTLFVVDLPAEAFRYRFPGQEIVKPIVRPDMIAKVVDFMGYAGAQIEIIKEETVPQTEKANLKTHSREQLMAMIADGKADQIHGRTLQNLRNMNAKGLAPAPAATSDEETDKHITIAAAPSPALLPAGNCSRDDEISILRRELAIRLKARMSDDQQLLAMLEGEA